MIIFDASTLILLAKADLLDAVLGSGIGTVLIPTEVEAECGARESLDALLIGQAIREQRIIVRRLALRKLCDRIRADCALGKGEAAAIALAVAAKAGIVGIDDQHGINACKLLKVPFTTAIGILIVLREKQLIDRQRAISTLDTLARHGRYKAKIIQDARAQLEGL